MDMNTEIVSKLKEYGVGRRNLNDGLFSDKHARLGIYEVNDEHLCHAVIQTTCTVPGCVFIAESLLEFENHYNSSHRFACSQCKKCLPSPHLLDLHLQEQHDSFFSVLAAKKPSYSCYIEECKEKFMNTDLRLEHCIETHKLPKDFRFEHKSKQKKKNKIQFMDIEKEQKKEKKFSFNNSKLKGFRKFTKDERSTASVDMDEIMADIKQSLP